MNKSLIATLVLIIALSITACGRNNNPPDTKTTILPDVMPTLETNIPDPDVDTKMPIYTDATTPGTTDPTGHTNGKTRSGF